MILVASFLFYRILKSGFDSWKAILIDFGIVLFLFGLQYYLQMKQRNNTDDQSMFPAGPLSTFFGTTFPSKIALDTVMPTIGERPSVKPEEPRYGCYLQFKDHLFMNPKEKKIIEFNNKIESQYWKPDHHQFRVKDSGFYMIQMTCDVDNIPYSAKLSLRGKINNIDKTIHDGENSFVVYLKGQDELQLEIENLKNNVMIQDTTTLYLIKL